MFNIDFKSPFNDIFRILTNVIYLFYENPFQLRFENKWPVLRLPKHKEDNLLFKIVYELD